MMSAAIAVGAGCASDPNYLPLDATPPDSGDDTVAPDSGAPETIVNNPVPPPAPVVAAGVRWVGRVDTTDATRPKFAWSGSGSRLEAMEVEGLKVASAGFLMSGNQGLALGSGLGDLLLGRLLTETDWGDVEVLVVDLPPGISFTQQGVLSGAGRVATILVVTPAEVSHLDTGRALGALRQVRTPVLGGVENMAYFECPCCGERTELHAPVPDARTIWAGGVERLARLPFRPHATIATTDLAPVLTAVEAHIAGS